MKQTDPDPQFPDSSSLIQRIFLVGMPGAGKTFWGEKLAKAHDLQFIDLDVFVARQQKASIAALFASYGEAGFRERERKALEAAIATGTDLTIVACGGGTPCFSNNMELMKDSGTVVYLQADIPSLVRNIEDSGEVRPLLKGRGDMATYLAGLLQQRKKYYEQAHHILQTKDISLATFAEIISSCTNRQ